MTAASAPNALESRLTQQLDQFRRDGVYKRFNHLESPQAARVRMEGRGEVIILSSNNYLGLSNHPTVMAAGKDGLDRFGAGTASVRFICGTFTIHRDLEQACARLVGTEAAMSFVSCWNANEALPATVLTEHDLILSDQLNHASIIDALRLAKSITKCETGVYKHGDLAELDQKLAAAKRPTGEDGGDRRRLLHGGFDRQPPGAAGGLPPSTARSSGSMTRTPPASSASTAAAPPSISTSSARSTSSPPRWARRSAERPADSSPARPTLCDFIAQRARPQLFTNALPATVAASALAAIEVLEAEPDRVERLRENTNYFRTRLLELGFNPLAGETPIVPVILGETAAAIRMSELLLEEGVFVTGFGFPVVPQGQARVRCQISAAHSREDLDQALAAFTKVGKKLGLL